MTMEAIHIKEESDEPSLVGPKEIRIQKRGAPPSSQEHFRNPFQEEVNRRLTKKATVLVITGFPGIGKTRFLILLFHLRIAANLPTLLVCNKTNAYFYKNGQLGIIPVHKLYSTVFVENIPPSTWCLIDSNDEVVAVPHVIIESKRFIVQTTSPRADHMKYTRKLNQRPQCCVMKPWSLPELIVGLFLQQSPDLKLVSEANVEAFYKRFGGSARNLYRYISEQNAFEVEIDDAARQFDAQVIERILRSADLTTITVPDAVGHMLLSAFPLVDDGDRCLYQIRPPSEAMMVKVLNRLDESEHEARLRMYRICVAVETPGCRMWASHLLDKHFHDFLLKGGIWPLHSFKKPTTIRLNSATHGFKAEEQPEGMFLRCHAGMALTTNETMPPNIATTPSIEFNTSNLPSIGESLLPGVYYRPSHSNHPTFDGLYVDAPGHAFGFQASIRDKHDIKKEGLDWLRNRGITKITYIYVMPAGPWQGPLLHVPVELEDYFDRLLCMRLIV
ncbi:hypothetical protein B0H13DRAFT_971088 [Mycena leptocephala]|nr:hypothetical protein B0H13DRAFT_971088 [Mycena leptocephala]